ncbi:MAG: FkbM family methyltransferase [Rhodospirillaceae bacterium]
MPSTALKGLFRSLRIYHGHPDHNHRLDATYGPFLRPGNVAFDIGSHVGDRISSFRRLGARVIALEPQPLAQRALRLIHGRDPLVSLVPAACGAEPGTVTFFINPANPTVSTGSAQFIDAAQGAPGWEGQQWSTATEVPCTTLDQLIAEHGRPDFVKIDVEGFEAAVLEGLSEALPAISFEMTTIQRDVAEACIHRLMALGPYRFTFSLGESHAFAFAEPITAEEMIAHLQGLPPEANSGDVYAILSREHSR